MCVWACQQAFKTEKQIRQLTHWCVHQAKVTTTVSTDMLSLVDTIIMFKPASTALAPCCYSKVPHAVYVETCLSPKASIHTSVTAICIFKVKKGTHHCYFNRAEHQIAPSIPTI